MAIIARAHSNQILVIEAPDYERVNRYLVIYGLEVTRARTKAAAFAHFKDKIRHANECEGLNDSVV